MEPGYPVWTIRPNWAGGILERLRWLTDVIASADTGVEQRRALNLSPRRSVEITVNPTRNERTFLDLSLQHLGSEKWLFPLWFDQGKVSADTVLAGKRVNFDIAFRETGLGAFALLYQDTFTWEVISIESVDANGVNLVDPLARAWPKGTPIYPLRLAQLSSDTRLSSITSQVGDSSLLFQLVQENDYPEIAPAGVQFEGRPVLTTPPNYSAVIDTQHIRLAEDLDNDTGLPYRYDPLDCAFSVQSHNWLIQGREALSSFRSFLYWLRGRQRSLWLPTFSDDLFVARAAAQGAGNLDVEQIGIAYTGGIVPGRDAVLIDGQPSRLTGIGAPQAPGEERLRIAAGLPAAVPKGMTGSFMAVARLNQDQVEVQHHTDIDGTTEIAATFQTFNPARDPSGTIYYPVPITERNAIPCGTDGDTSTVYDFYTVHFETSPPGMFGRPGLGNQLVVSDVGPADYIEYICGDPAWQGGRVSHFRKTAEASKWVESNIKHTQQGQGTNDCKGYGAGYGVYYHYVKGNAWPAPRKCPAVGVSAGEVIDPGGIRIDFFGNFPEEATWRFYPDFNDPRYLA
jgi:hypothetical protein